MVEREKEILHINSKNQSLGSSVCQKGDGGVSFRPKKLGFQEPFHILERGNPVERGNQFLKGGTKKSMHTRTLTHTVV